MDSLYQSLVTVNPVTLIAQIVNLFLQLLLVRVFFLDKIKAVLDRRREAADREIQEAQAARGEAAAMKRACEKTMREASAHADRIIAIAQQTAAARSEEIVTQAHRQADRIREQAESDISREKKKALNEAKNEISAIAIAIAGKVVCREITADDQAGLVEDFLDGLDAQL